MQYREVGWSLMFASNKPFICSENMTGLHIESTDACTGHPSALECMCAVRNSVVM